MQLEITHYWGGQGPLPWTLGGPVPPPPPRSYSIVIVLIHPLWLKFTWWNVPREIYESESDLFPTSAVQVCIN